MAHLFYEFAGFPDTWATVDTRDTRNGFAHDAHVHGDVYGAHTSHYLNRTWESWTGQSAILAAIRDDVDNMRVDLLNSFKRENGYRRMTPARREAFDLFLTTDDDDVREYRHALDLLDMVSNSTCEYAGRNGYIIRPRES